MSLSLAARSVTVASSLGVDAAHDDAAHVVAARDQRLRRDERRGADDLRDCAAPRPPCARQSGSASPLGVAAPRCARSPTSMRSRTSFWKPFITDSTMISAATPSAMPSIETPEMNEMKRLRRAGAAGARVAPADLQFVGPVHAGRCYPSDLAAPLRDAARIIRACTCSFRSRPTRSEACRHVLHGLALPNLERLLALLTPAARDEGDAGSLSPPHERALAAAWGWQGDDGLLPFAAHAPPATASPPARRPGRC